MIAREDIVLAVAAEIALNVRAAPGRLHIEYDFGDDQKADKIVQRIIRAVRARLRFIDSHGNHVDVRERAREMVLDILAQKKDLSGYRYVIAAFAARNDKDFMTRLATGFRRGRKAVFNDLEWFLLFHDGELTDEQVAKRFDKTLFTVRNKRQRLGLHH
jgi:hypothetical protein